jgi:beta-phosphoglucomutase-like phosphatase (HAD superfamily)
MERKTAVLFDVDGTLLDTEGLQYRAWNNTLSELSLPTLTAESYSKLYCGRSAPVIASEFVRHHSLNITSEQFLQTRTAHLESLIADSPINQMSGAYEVLEYFAKTGLVALPTGGDYHETQLKLEKAGLSGLVSQYNIPIISRNMVVNSKPAPDTYIKTLADLGINCDQAVAIEDTLAGIQSAEAAGVQAIAVPNQWTARQFASSQLTCANLQIAKDYILNLE